MRSDTCLTCGLEQPVDPDGRPEWSEDDADHRHMTLVELVAVGLVTAERDFSMRVGSGDFRPGQYLTDRDRAAAVLATLAANRLQVIPVPSDG